MKRICRAPGCVKAWYARVVNDMGYTAVCLLFGRDCPCGQSSQWHALTVLLSDAVEYSGKVGLNVGIDHERNQCWRNPLPAVQPTARVCNRCAPRASDVLFAIADTLCQQKRAMSEFLCAPPQPRHGGALAACAPHNQGKCGVATCVECTRMMGVKTLS